MPSAIRAAELARDCRQTLSGVSRASLKFQQSPFRDDRHDTCARSLSPSDPLARQGQSSLASPRQKREGKRDNQERAFCPNRRNCQQRSYGRTIISVLIAFCKLFLVNFDEPSRPSRFTSRVMPARNTLSRVMRCKSARRFAEIFFSQ